MDRLRPLIAVLVIFAVSCPSRGRHVSGINVRTAAGTVRRLHATIEPETTVESTTTAAGVEDSIIANRYIVALEDGYGDAGTAASVLVEEVRTALRSAAGAATAAAVATAGQAADADADAAALDTSSQAVAAAEVAPAEGVPADAAASPQAQPEAAAGPAASATDGEEDIAVVKVGQAAATAADLGVAAAAAGDSAPAATIVLRASQAAIQRVRRSSRVKAVIHDRYIRAQARALSQAEAPCVTSGVMRTGVSTSSAADIKPALATSFKALRCNVANARYVWKGSLCRGSASNINFTVVEAVDRTTNAPLRTSTNALCRLVRGPTTTVTMQRFGGCGVAPVLAPSLPMRVCSATGGNGGGLGVGTTPAGAVMPKVPLQPREQVPSGVGLIEAATRAGVGDMKAGKTVVVAVVDSGVDATHPDLNYMGGKGFVIPSTMVPNDSADPAQDLYGHGTHVSGIIGAKNDNLGLVGVAPGVGIFSLKVLDAQGVGSLSDAMDAVAWAAGPEGKAAGIQVINLSLAMAIEPTAEDYQATVDLVCDVFRRASNAGIMVAAAAGNYARDIRGYLPAACPTVIAVTSVDPELHTPSSFSNFLSEPATLAEKGSVMAAPGNAIKSTISYARESSGYRELSGTSMASPHIAGVAAACIASGACAEATGFANSALLQAAARERLRVQPPFGFSGDARTRNTGKYYGNLVWAKW